MTIFTFPIVNSSSLLGSGQTVEMPKMETWESSLASTVYSNFLLDQQVIRRSSLCFSHMYHGFHVTLLPQGISFLFCWVLEYTKQMWGSEFSNTQVFKQRWGLPHQRDFFFLQGFYLEWQVYPMTSWPLPTAESNIYVSMISFSNDL